MHSLENEQAIYQNLALQNRNDLISSIVLTRIDAEIQKIKGQDDKKGKTISCANTGGVIQFLRKVVHRLRHNKD